MCQVPNWDSLNEIDEDDDDDDLKQKYSCTEHTLQKIPVLRGLLACAVLMLICNIIFIVTYIIVFIRLRIKEKSDNQAPDVVYQQQTASVYWGDQSSHNSAHMSFPPQEYPTENIPTTLQLPSAPPPPYEMSVNKS